MSEKKKRGFATLPKEQVAEIARKGGVSAHAQGAAHEWDRAAAKAAGSKGGKAFHAKRRAAAEKTFIFKHVGTAPGAPLPALDSLIEHPADRSNTSAVAAEDDLGANS